MEHFAGLIENETVDSDVHRFCRLIAKIMLRAALEQKPHSMEERIDGFDDIKNTTWNLREGSIAEQNEKLS